MKLSHVLGAAIVSAATVSAVNAGVTLDVRVHDTGGKTATVAGIGDTVQLDLYAVMTGADASTSNEGLQSVLAKLTSSNGGLAGNLAVSIDSNFQLTGFQNGTIQDLDGDSDLDVGGTNTGVTNNWLYARGPTTFIGGNEVLFATATFTVTDTNLLAGESTNINLQRRGGSIDVVWREDGATKTAVANVSSGAPVVISVATVAAPEPASVAILAVAGAGLLARRRR